MTTVIVLGGGMGGLSAAFELARRGFQVSVYEKNAACGGKARSFGYQGSGTGGRPDLPAEHGFRFFPGFYRHLVDTMKQIPYGSKKVFHNLVEAPEITIAQVGEVPFTFPSNVPTTVEEFVVLLKSIYQHQVLKLPEDEAWFFIRQIICFLGSCTERREQQYENIPWWDYIDAANKSAQYRKICARGLTRSLVAMRSEEGSTLTVGTILVQILWNILNINEQSDRVLNGPTSDVWITPWVNQMQNQYGVNFYNNAEVIGFQSGGSALTGARIRQNGNETTVAGDYYVVALPVEVVRTRMTDAQMNAAGIQGIKQLKVESMNGALFYTNRDVTMTKGHAIYADSPWALTSIEQRQFWTSSFNLSQYGNGKVVDILSSIISEWEEPGTVSGEPASQAPNANTILDEIWEQLKAHRTLAGPGSISDLDLEDKFLDPAISWGQAGISNQEPLLVNTVGSRQHRPQSATQFSNMFLAADYVRTHTDLATMEAANEAGRRAARGIMIATGASTSLPKLWKLREPPFFAFWKGLDEITYNLFGPATDPPICGAFDIIRDTIDVLERRAIDAKQPSPAEELLRRMFERGLAARQEPADDEE